MEKVIIITSDDEIKTVDHGGENNYEVLRDAVEGLIEHFQTLDNVQLSPFNKPINVDLWCNEEFTYSEAESCKKVNPVASALYNGNLIFGNIALTIQMPEGESRGFEYIADEDGGEQICECWFMEDILIRMKNAMERDGVIADMHKQFDNNCPEPKMDFVSLDSDEDMEKAMDCISKGDMKGLQEISNKQKNNKNRED